MEQKLYEIAEAVNKLEEMEDQEAVGTYLDGVKMQLKEKAENIFRVIKNIETPIIAVEEEIKRLQALKQKYKLQADRLRTYVSETMQKNEIEKITTDIATFSFRKSTSVKITDEEKLPKEFMKETVKVAPDKVAIGKLLKAGEKIEGATLSEKKNLQIK